MIPHSRPSLDKKEVEAVAQVIESAHIAQGSMVKKFEQVLGRYIGCPYAAAVSSGTAALHLSLLALDIGSSDEVIIPSYVCTALLNAIHYVGANPVVVDIDERTFNIHPESVASKISTRTRAIVVPHMFGCPADLEALSQFNLPIIEDCAQAIGAQYRERPVGSWGTLAIFSFYATKMITTGEGGMVLSHSKELINRIKCLREYDNKNNFGLRFNYKMTDMQAAMGQVQLQKLPEFIQKRQLLALKYYQAFKDFNVKLPAELQNGNHIFYRYVVRIQADLDNIINLCESKQFQCRRPVFKPLHHYLKQKDCPVTDLVYREALSIPIYPSLTQDQQDYIIENLGEILRQL